MSIERLLRLHPAPIARAEVPPPVSIAHLTQPVGDVALTAGLRQELAGALECRERVIEELRQDLRVDDVEEDDILGHGQGHQWGHAIRRDEEGTPVGLARRQRLQHCGQNPDQRIGPDECADMGCGRSHAPSRRTVSKRMSWRAGK